MSSTTVINESGHRARRPVAASGVPHRIRPSRGWPRINFREIWRYRELLVFLTQRDVKVRYKQTLIGGAWAILQPVLLMVVFTVFLGRLAKLPSGDVPYPLFVYAGLLPWTFFACGIANAGNSIIGSEKLVTKVYFPRLLIPLASINAALFDLAIASSVLGGLLLWHGVTPSWSLMLIPLVVAMIYLVALGIGSMLAALTVSYRDFRYVTPFLIQLWLFATPTIYMSIDRESAQQSETALSPTLHALVELNPLTSLVAVFRDCVLGEPIDGGRVALSGAIALAVAIIGCLLFRRMEDRFADVI